MAGTKPPSGKKTVPRSSQAKRSGASGRSGKRGTHPKPVPFLEKMPRLSLDDVGGVWSAITLQEPIICAITREKTIHLELPCDVATRMANTFHLLMEAVEPRDAFMKLHKPGKKRRGLEGLRRGAIPWAFALFRQEYPDKTPEQVAQLVVESELCTLGLSKSPTTGHVLRLFRQWIATAGEIDKTDSLRIAFVAGLLGETLTQLHERYD